LTIEATKSSASLRWQSIYFTQS